jgi:uncharacterized membrane protein YphA (DoxX/SURF4 family)
MNKSGLLADTGRIFYGAAIAALGFLTIYHRDLPYMLIPARHPWLKAHELFIYVSGVLLLTAGVCIILKKKPRRVAGLLGLVLLLVFCFYFIPYMLSSAARYAHFGAWENSAKELALAGGALLIAGYSSAGARIYALTIISFSIDHFLFAHEAAGYMPGWIAQPVFWLYFCGVALLAAGVAILIGIKVKLAATLLGSMILSWVIIVHIPKMMAAPFAQNEGEVTSGFIALAYSGIAFIIAAEARSNRGFRTSVL